MNIEQIDRNGYRIGIPVPFPMKYVYCYLFQNNDDYVLIDVGYNYKAAKEAWEEVFKQFNIKPTAVKTIYLTHFHPDHSGLTGWMQELTGAKVYMHEVDKKMIERVWGRESVQTKHMKERILDHGVPEQLSEDIIEHMEMIANHVLPLPAAQNIIGEQVEFGGRMWKVIHTPGHSDGHICFYQEEEQVLIAGDHILDKITPNISVWPGASQRPLHDYIDSLKKIKSLKVKKAWSAHGSPITNVDERIDELINHHEERLAKIEALSKEKTTFEIAEALFAHKELSPHQWRFAIAETMAHLYYLVHENRIQEEGNRPVVYKSIS